MKKTRKILIYYFGHIGDTLVTYPAIRMIRKNYPDAELFLMNHYTTKNPLHAELFAGKELFSEIYLFAPPNGFLEKIRFYCSFFSVFLKHRFDRIFVFSFHRNYSKTIALSSLLFQFKKQKLVPFSETSGRSIYQEYIRVLQGDGLVFSEDIFDFPLTEAEKSTAERTALEITQGQAIPMIAFGVGGKQSVCLWNLENYIQLIKLLKTKINFIPVYIGSPSDRKSVEKLISDCGGIFLPDTDCKTLREVIAFYKRCLCYIGNDSGSAHLAGIAGLKSAILYPAHDLPQEKWYPVGNGHLFIRKDVPCAGCGKGTCPKEPPSCLEMITPTEVFEKVVPWLGKI